MPINVYRGVYTNTHDAGENHFQKFKIGDVLKSS